MANVLIELDRRKKSQSKRSGLFPVVFKIRHKTVHLISAKINTSPQGWDSLQRRLRQSAYANRNLDCTAENKRLDQQLLKARNVLNELGTTIDSISGKKLVQLVKESWDYSPDSELRKRVLNDLSLETWGEKMIKRKRAANIPGTAKWLKQGIDAIKDFNDGQDILLYNITVTFLKDFEAFQRAKGNSNNTIGIYLGAVRSLYSSAINEDRLAIDKNPFQHYKIPKTSRTRKRALSQENLSKLANLNYKKESTLWHAQNYMLIMFYCRGMNFVDLVKLKVHNIVGDRLYYGRSKTGDQLSIKLNKKLHEILNYYLNLTKTDYLLPTNYDGSTEHYQKYKSQRRRMNERLKQMAIDAGLDAVFTTYTIRHSWATLAKYSGISTTLISEGLGHSSVKTTEIYLKDFENVVLDEVSDKVASLI